MTGLPFHARVATIRSHALWVAGLLGIAYFSGQLDLQRYANECKLLKVAFDVAADDEEKLTELALATATAEEVLAEGSNGTR